MVFRRRSHKDRWIRLADRSPFDSRFPHGRPSTLSGVQCHALFDHAGSGSDQLADSEMRPDRENWVVRKPSGDAAIADPIPIVADGSGTGWRLPAL